MSETRSDPPRRNRPDPAPGERKRSAPSTDAAIPIPSEDVLGDMPEPTDDSPTIVSKNAPRPPQPGDDALRGRKLAHFELLEQIGAGGMAAVLRARDSQLDRIVALKILPPDMAADAENVQRFHQEARSAAKLDHENIARVFFCGEDQRLHFIAFEFVEGENLRVILERRGRLPVGEALPYIIQVAAGLAHAAERGVVHRDIKPSNIIITPAGRAKLVDMGLARTLGPQKDEGLTHSGVTLGTFDYISPEQALEPRDADVRSDIYSLGCTFYHMITGRAPVPEGTAAKKLHYHQHVPPTDPRELVPGLPDEIALVLDRMMAKDPRSRYQNAGELVQHLLTAAKHLHVGADVPEGVLFVDAPLPRTGGGRPYLMVGLAVAAVVALLVFLDQPAANPSIKPAPRGDVAKKDDLNNKVKDDNPKDKPPPRVEKDPKPPEVPVQFAEGERVYQDDDVTAEKLINWLKDIPNVRRIRIQLAGDLKLKVEDGKLFAGLVVKADEVTIEPKTPGTHPTIELIYAGGTTQPCAALALHANRATVTGIRFRVDASGSDGAALVGLQLVGGKEHAVTRCEFLQATPSKESRSLVAETDGQQTSLNLSESAFLGYVYNSEGHLLKVGGKDAVCGKGPVAIKVANCVFGPHANVFRIESGMETLALDHCSVMLGGQMTVFEMMSEAKAKLSAHACIFARTSAVPETDGATLIRVATPEMAVHFTGVDNRYYWLSAFRTAPDAQDITTLDAFNKGSGTSDNSLVLNEVPWRDDGCLTRPEVARMAFLPDLEMEELRLVQGKELIGIEWYDGKSLTENLRPVEKRNDPEKSQKRFVNTAPGKKNSTRGVYATLKAAVLDSKSGDTIFIRHNGELAESAIRLEAADFELTIKPEPGYRPILVLGDTKDLEASLFRLHSGRLHLEGLEIVLRPRQDFRSLTAVTLLGDGRVLFKDCAVTLNRGMQSTQLSVVTLPDPKSSMEMKPATPRTEGKPHIGFSNSFIRGTGEVVLDQTARTFDLEARGSLIAVSGSLCSVVDVPAGSANPEQVSSLTLSKTTTFLGENLLHVQTGVNDLDKLPVHQITAGECLFLPGREGLALIRFESQDTDQDNVKDKLEKKLRWAEPRDPPRANAFGTFDSLVSHMAEGGEQNWKFEAWQAFGRDNKIRQGIDLTARETPLFQLVPEQLRVEKLSNFGAEVKSLPVPSAK